MDYEMEELLPIVSELAWKSAGGESTSVTYEKAQALMEAVLYCLAEYSRSTLNSPARRNISVREQYDTGLRLVYEKAGKIRDIFNELSPEFQDFGVKCLYDTVQKGIPQFLKWYDAGFCPQNTILALDYPLLKDFGVLSGADAVYEYLCSIRTEQRFLRSFDRNYVISVLERYDPEYQEMVENICGIVLTDTIGHAAIRKPPDAAGFQEEDYLQLSEVFGRQSVDCMEKNIKRLIKMIVRQFYANDRDMAMYLCHSARDMAVRIDTGIRYGRLDKLF